jgi:carbonic anhydrase
LSAIDELLENNRRYSEDFEHTGLSSAPAKKVAVLCCMDARVIPSRILGLEPGDGHVIKNAGGVVTDDAIRSISLSQNLLGTDEIVVIQHTDCGMSTFTDEEYAERLERETGQRPAWSAQAFSDLDQSVRDSVQTLRESPFIPHTDAIRGFVYDVETGALREVS